jgi:Cu+-exporting ATPase
MKKKQITFKISGMHCTSCAFNIDGELEDTEGVIESNTNYAKQQTQVEFDETKIDEKKITKILKEIGYTALAS